MGAFCNKHINNDASKGNEYSSLKSRWKYSVIKNRLSKIKYNFKD